MANIYVEHEIIPLRSNPEYSEKWVQDIIAKKPSILRLGDLILRDRERIHPGAGRLDLLFQDSEINLRYEVEIQLGKTDESHIIRTIEYWDIEKKRYPQYDHVAVIVAEDITSRFLNIIGLFNGFIPLVALQMNAVKVGENITLIFTKVFDQRASFGEGEEEIAEVTDRGYWEKRGTKATVLMADEMLNILKGVDEELELKYNKFYIGMAKSNKPFNFVIFRPKKQYLRVEPKLAQSQQIEEKLEAAGLDVMEYISRDGRYRIRLLKDDIEKHRELLRELFTKAYNEYTGYEQN